MADRPARLPAARRLAVPAAALVSVGVVTMAVALLAGPGVGATGYVSEAGTTTYPLADAYRIGVVVLAAGVAGLGGAVAALSGLAAVLLGAAAVGAALSGAVPCSNGCPLPPFEDATGADLVHAGASVVGMAACVFAMVTLAATTTVTPWLRRLAVAGAGVALPLSGALALAMLFLGRDPLTGRLERALLLTAAAWLVATATVRAGPQAPRRAPAPAVPSTTHGPK